MEEHGDEHNYEGSTMQEFISGTRYYLQFLVSPYADNQHNLRFFGIDRRDESDIDEFYKLGSRGELMKLGVYPTFNVTGNVPAVMRESLLMREAVPAAKRVITASKELVEEGLIGPFCLESTVDADSNVYYFEISARIVAGSNAMVDGSPYTQFSDRKPNVNYADWMMDDLARATKAGELGKLVT